MWRDLADGVLRLLLIMTAAFAVGGFLALLASEARAEGQESAKEESFQPMSAEACERYAHDAQRLALMRNGGVPLETVRRTFAPLRDGFYGEAAWPYFLDLLHETYAVDEGDPVGWALAHFANCMNNGGVRRLGRT